MKSKGEFQSSMILLGFRNELRNDRRYYMHPNFDVVLEEPNTTNFMLIYRTGGEVFSSDNYEDAFEILTGLMADSNAGKGKIHNGYVNKENDGRSTQNI